ncbi:hypothetical protein F383_23185 [Gossypium arboreum]|uniref:Uncharacterized protein n=1 Tax=Gossypium arboreum TaxID=29729 RepID=A0A0B0NZM1_GOSAR|nr:hypothetical protein F383_23185 [Gossypium arboreum]
MEPTKSLGNYIMSSRTQLLCLNCNVCSDSDITAFVACKFWDI